MVTFFFPHHIFFHDTFLIFVFPCSKSFLLFFFRDSVSLLFLSKCFLLFPPPRVFFLIFFTFSPIFFFEFFTPPPHFFFFKFYKIFHFFFKIFYSESTTFIEGLQLHLVNPWVFKTSFGRGLLEDFWTSRISK